MRDYKNLLVWKKSHELTLHVNRTVIPLFPKSEQLELTSQIKRAAYSIPLNIVEGCGRYTEKDFTHFLDNALGSCHEVEYCSFLAYELGYINHTKYEEVNKIANEVKAMLIAFIKTLRKE